MDCNIISCSAAILMLQTHDCGQTYVNSDPPDYSKYLVL